MGVAIRYGVCTKLAEPAAPASATASMDRLALRG